MEVGGAGGGRWGASMFFSLLFPTDLFSAWKFSPSSATTTKCSFLSLNCDVCVCRFPVVQITLVLNGKVKATRLLAISFVQDKTCFRQTRPVRVPQLCPFLSFLAVSQMFKRWREGSQVVAWKTARVYTVTLEVLTLKNSFFYGEDDLSWDYPLTPPYIIRQSR